MGTSIRSQAINGIKWSAFCKVYTSVVSVLQVAVLTRFLEKEDFGLMGIAILVNSFCLIFVDMGMSTAAMHEQNLSQKQFSSFYWFNLISGFSFFLLVSLISPLIANYYHYDKLTGIISYSSFSIFISSIYSLQRTIQQKKMNFLFMSAVEIIASTVALISNVLFAINGQGVYSLVWSQLIANIIMAVLYLFVAISKEHNICFHFCISEIIFALKIGIYQVGASVCDFISREMDSLIISSNMSIELFGIYTLCKNLTSRVYQVINPIVTNVLTPILSKMQNEKQRLSEIYVKCVNVLGYVNFVVYGLLSVCAFSILTILYGETYNDYSMIMACLSIYYAIQGCGNPIGSLLVATGKTDCGFYWTIFRILFTSFYLSLASLFNIEVFVLLVALSPILLAYPNWWIILRKISTIDFLTAFILPIKPLLLCIPLLPLFFLSHMIKTPILSILIVGGLFLVGYLILNQIFRRDLQIYIFNALNMGYKNRKDLYR